MPDGRRGWAVQSPGCSAAPAAVTEAQAHLVLSFHDAAHAVRPTLCESALFLGLPGRRPWPSETQTPAVLRSGLRGLSPTSCWARGRRAAADEDGRATAVSRWRCHAGAGRRPFKLAVGSRRDPAS